MTDPLANPAPDDEAPPAGMRWGALYALVLGALAVVIAALFWLTERYR